MRTVDFWQLIEQARAGAGTPEAVAVRAVALLAERDPEEIVGYVRHQRRVLVASRTVDLWGAAYLINGGASDDGFEYFRGWLMTQGREVFGRAVRDPDSLAELPQIRAAAMTGEEFACEDMLAVAWEAYRKVTASDLPVNLDPVPPADLDEFWDFDDPDEARRRLPRLAELFGEPPE